VVFCDRREDAQLVAEALRGRSGVEDDDVELLVGARRVYERTQVNDWLVKHGFLSPPKLEAPPLLERHAFAVATSAGEVGVDMNADHMVSDLVAWERMVQRLGRVNRRGGRDVKAQVVVIPAAQDNDERAERLAATIELIHKLPRDGEVYDASPGAITDLKAGEMDLVRRASTPAPLYPPLSRAALEAWSMTSLAEHTGRSRIAPWLRGWVDDQPQTTVVWRQYLPIRRADGRDELLSARDLETFFDAAEPLLAEQLDTETSHVIDWLDARLAALRAKRGAGGDSGGGDAAQGDRSDGAAEAAERTERVDPEQEESTKLGAEDTSPESVGSEDPSDGDAAAAPRPWEPRDNDIVGVVRPRGNGAPQVLRVRDVTRKNLEEILREATLIVDARIGGLRIGLLRDDCTFEETVSDAPLDLVSDDRAWAASGVRVQWIRDLDKGDPGKRSPDEGPPGEGQPNEKMKRQWRREARIAVSRDREGEEDAWLLIDSDDKTPARSADGSSNGPAQLLDVHQAWTEAAAQRIARALGLDPEDEAVVTLAARLHDEGKRAPRWQQAFRARRDGDGVYGKTTSRPNQHELNGYRHELGSLPRAERDPRVQALDPERLRDGAASRRNPRRQGTDRAQRDRAPAGRRATCAGRAAGADPGTAIDRPRACRPACAAVRHRGAERLSIARRRCRVGVLWPREHSARSGVRAVRRSHERGSHDVRALRPAGTALALGHAGRVASRGSAAAHRACAARRRVQGWG
jgi:CRISPR-associated endonuclease/helicase Cas3